MILIKRGGLEHPRVVEILARHFAKSQAETAPGSNHVLDVSKLLVPGISFWTAWDGDAAVGTGALKVLTADHGEVKSMYTDEAARRRGVGGQMLRHIIGAAREAGLRRLSLQTGGWAYFKAARDLYERHGFEHGPAFGDYRPDPHSAFMTREL